MAQLVVRNLEESVKARLRRRASRHGHSMEAEVRDILRDAVKAEEAPGLGLGTRINRRFAHIGFDEGFPELRGEKARPAEFKK